MRRIAKTTLTIGRMPVVIGSPHTLHGVSRIAQECGNSPNLDRAGSSVDLDQICVAGVLCPGAFDAAAWDLHASPAQVRRQAERQHSASEQIEIPQRKATKRARCANKAHR
jgi:hypothetical protein